MTPKQVGPLASEIADGREADVLNQRPGASAG